MPHPQHEVFPTSYVTASYLRNILNFDKKVYLMGLPGFAQELDLQGISWIGPGPDPLVGGPADWVKLTLDPEVSFPLPESAL